MYDHLPPRLAIINVSHHKPLSFIGECAGISHGKTDASIKRALGCWRVGHTSVLEHVAMTFRIDGISRACSHQLVRHRLASFVQESQRYTKIDVWHGDWYVIPPTIEQNEGLCKQYKDHMADVGRAYDKALYHGIKPEDARYLLPEATKTSVVMTTNLRELEAFYKLRSDKAAQWEIRELACSMLEAVGKLDYEWQTIADMIYQHAIEG